MALPHLTDEQTRTWTRAEKDRWWLENVYRGNMPQLTIRSAITGFFLGGILSATNLYIGAKTGWTLGVGVTSVILSFVMFRALSKLRFSKDMTILENNAVQSIATAAGYMTGPLISALMAYMFVTNTTLEWHKMLIWNVVASLLGVLVAFPMKRRFINDEQQPFPEGRACAVVLDSLYPDAAQGGTKNMVDGVPVAHPRDEADGGVDAGLFKAKALAIAAAIGAGLQLLVAAGYMSILQIRMMGTARATDAVRKIPERLDEWYYSLAERGSAWMPNVRGVPLHQLGLTLAFDLSMIGAGGLMGMRIANSVMLGMVTNFLFVAPSMIGSGEIVPKNFPSIANPDGTYLVGDAVFGRAHLTNTWCLWWGVAMMVTASMVGLFAKPKMIASAFAGLFSRKQGSEDCLRDIEFPIRWSLVGIPLVSAVIIYINHEWFGVSWWIGALSIPLIIVLTLIAANATALTSTTPTGSLSKITQFTFGALQPTNPATNLMTAGVTTEVASNASNLLMDIKPGYMLGAKPRQQALGHCIGIVAGAIASTPLFYLLFMWTKKPDVAIEQHVTESWAVPGAVQWAAISKVIGGMGSGGESVQVGADGIAKLWGVLPLSAAWAMLAGAALAIAFEAWRIASKGRFPLSAVGIGLGVVLPPESTVMMWTGAALFTAFERKYHRAIGSFGWRLWVDSKEAVCAGLIAGWALLGIGDGIIAAVTSFPESEEAVVAREAGIRTLDEQLSAAPQDMALAARLGVALLADSHSGAERARARELLRRAEENGIGEASVILGRDLEEHGEFTEAAARYRTGISHGSKAAATALVELYGTGRVTDPDERVFLEAQATAGSPAAQRVVGIRLLSDGDKARATELLNKSAQAGDAQGAWRFCQAAQGTAQPSAIAHAWITAARGGVREAGTMLDAVAPTIVESESAADRLALAALVTNGKGGRIDPALARKALEASRDDPQVAMALAKHLAEQSPTREGEAAAVYLRLANAGSADAMVALGELIARVDAHPGKREAVAKALEATDLRATATRLWQVAAAKGDAQAMFDLGWQAHDGWGRAADPSTAMDWWSKAAARSNGRAMYRLGRMLADASNPTDRVDAMVWLRLAAKRGVAGAEQFGTHVDAALKEQERATVNERVAAWHPSSP